MSIHDRPVPVLALQYAFHYGSDLGNEPHRQRPSHCTCRLNLTPPSLTRFVTTPSDFDPATSALSEAQNSTISYRFIHEIRYLVIYKTMFEYSKDPKIWQLQHDEWAECTEESGSVSLRCLGCSALVMFDAWEVHRDACLGIEDKMVRAVMADMVSEQPEDEDHQQCWRIRSLRGSPVVDEDDVEVQDDEFVEAHESKRKSLGMRLCSALHFIGRKHSKE